MQGEIEGTPRQMFLGVRRLLPRGGLENRVRNIVLNSLHCKKKVSNLGRNYSNSDSFLKMAEQKRLVWVDLEVNMHASEWMNVILH